MMQPLIVVSAERIRLAAATEALMKRQGLEVPTDPLPKAGEIYVEMFLESDEKDSQTQYRTVPEDQVAALEAKGWKV